MYFTVELKGKREVVKLPARASIGDVAKAAFGNPDEPVTVVIATKSLDVANGARCAVWPSTINFLQDAALMPGIQNIQKVLTEEQRCAYCLDLIPDSDLERKNIWSPNWRESGGQSPLRNYHKSKNCAAYDQMAHEG